MQHPFIKFIVVVLCAAAVVAAHADVAIPDAVLDTPVTLNLSTSDFLISAPAGTWVAPVSSWSSGDLRSTALGSGAFPETPGKTWETLPLNGPQVNAVPLPEPSSEATLYFLSGAVGLALVVIRRRTLA